MLISMECILFKDFYPHIMSVAAMSFTNAFGCREVVRLSFPLEEKDIEEVFESDW